MAGANRAIAIAPPRALMLALATASLACTAPAAPISARELTDEHVRAAIEAIVDELYARKHAKLFWEPRTWEYEEHGQKSQVGGYTPLVVLSLLYAGESYQDERLRDAIEHLKSVKLTGTYAVSIRAQTWAQLPDTFRPQLQSDIEWMLNAFQPEVPGWGYDEKSAWYDNSLAQYGALALWEAAKRDVPIDQRHWRRIEERFLANQFADGGWNYRGNQPVTGSMTAAGLTVLFITQDYLHGRDYVEVDDGAPARQDRAIDLGLEWMNRNFSPSENPGRDTHFFYYLYGVERVGLASGYRFFGEHDWFREAAAEILTRLCAWDAAARSMSMHRTMRGDGRASRIHNDDLAFALLFLSRGRIPVAINKLRVDGWSWNNRPRDVANLTAWIGERAETALNWQVVDFSAPPHEWLDAPLLVIASHQPLPWSARRVEVDGYVREMRAFDRQRVRGALAPDARPPSQPGAPELEKLKTYLDLGGQALAINEGDKRLFADSIEQAGRIMYPHLEWRDLPSDHWAYRMLWPVRDRRLRLRGLSNGVRELIILSERADLSRTFQTRDPKRQSQYELAGNVYLYASEMNRPRPRLAIHAAAARAGDDANAITVVCAMYDGRWSPEPLALPVWRDALPDSPNLNVRIIDHPLANVHDLAPAPALVIVSGVDGYEFADAERTAIEEYIRAGGVILFETVGGRGEFTLAAEQTIAPLFDAPIRSLIRTRIVSGAGLEGASSIEHAEYRAFAQVTFGARETTPRLRGIIIDDQPRVLFSREDLSHALLDQPCWGIVGYAPGTARDLLGNIVQHAAALARER